MPVILIFKQMVMVSALVIPLRCVTFLTTLVSEYGHCCDPCDSASRPFNIHTFVQMPPPAAHCQHAWTPPQDTSKIFNPIESPRTGCGDQMFSGRSVRGMRERKEGPQFVVKTIIISYLTLYTHIHEGHVLHGTVVALMALRYFPYHRLLPLFAFAALAALAILLVIFRAHYTADVLTAIYVTWGGWLLMQPYETRDLTKYGIRADVLIRPNYQSMGTDPWRARQAIGPFEETGAAEARGGGGGGGGGALTRAMEEGKVAAVAEAPVEEKEKEEA